MEVAGGTRPIWAEEMTDSSDLLRSGGGGLAACRARLEADGYLLLRGFLPRADVLRARAFLLESLAADGFITPLPARAPAVCASQSSDSAPSSSASASLPESPSAASAAAVAARLQRKFSDQPAVQSGVLSASAASSKRRRSDRIASRHAPSSNEISANAALATSSSALHPNDESDDEFDCLDSAHAHESHDTTDSSSAYEWAAAHRAIALDATASPGYLGRADLHAAAPIHALVEHARLRRLFAAWFECAPKTTQYKWVRAMPPALFTGVHIDRVYMGRGSQRMLTAWIPIGDTPVEEGVMLVASGAHRDPRLRSLYAGYGASVAGSDGTASGWCAESAAELIEKYDGFGSRPQSNDALPAVSAAGTDETSASAGSRDAEKSKRKSVAASASTVSAASAAHSAALLPSEHASARSCVWRTSRLFRAGDIVLLTLDCLHLTTRNVQRPPTYRLSADTRWLPAHEPLDSRVH